MQTCDWVKRDLASIWHPFTQAQTALPPLAIVKGEGSYLYDASGKCYVDAISSWWVNLHGHAHPYIAEKIATQAYKLEHVIFAGYTHPQAITLAERLLTTLPKGYSRVFYSDNGSTAVEVALKMALQVVRKKKKVLSFQNGYHGDTFGAMAAAGKSYYNRPFWPYLFEVHSIVAPMKELEERSWDEFLAALKTNEIAVFIFEPLIQGAAGMRTHSKQVLSSMLRKCEEHGIITIADEVMTGFGRTGQLFACNNLEVVPDLLCLSKGITGGFLPLGATLAKEFLFSSFLSHDPAQAFLHGHSYTANPLACAAANASLDLLLTQECDEKRAMIERAHRAFQKELTNFHSEVLGTIFAMRLPKVDPQFFLDRGILLRPLKDVLYLIPPYSMSYEELQKIYNSIKEYVSLI